MNLLCPALKRLVRSTANPPASGANPCSQTALSAESEHFTSARSLLNPSTAIDCIR